MQELGGLYTKKKLVIITSKMCRTNLQKYFESVSRDTLDGLHRQTTYQKLIQMLHIVEFFNI